MYKKSKFILGVLFSISILSTSGCVFNINEDDDCLRCAYQENGREVTEELCHPFYTESEKATMRVRMQQVADSLDVSLNCSTH